MSNNAKTLLADFRFESKYIEVHGSNLIGSRLAKWYLALTKVKKY